MTSIGTRRSRDKVAFVDPRITATSAETPLGTITRSAGRQRTDGKLGYPARCTALSQHADESCGSEMAGTRCLVCVREGALSTRVPQWQGARFNVVDRPSIQAVRLHGSMWIVAVFACATRLNPRFPPIACWTRAEAIELAFARARQIEPCAPIDQRGEGYWQIGSLVFWTVGDGC